MDYLLILPFSYIALNVVYNLTFSIASLRPFKSTYVALTDKTNKIAVLIPAYKEDNVIVDSAIQAINHNYPEDMFDVFVIADQLQAPTIMKLDHFNINVLVVKFKKSSKAKAINSVLNQLEEYDIAVVLDADNIMKSNFLNHINEEYNKGSIAIQGQRIAKNEQNYLAQLDAISEGINNNIFRKGHQNLGLSSALIGSGMAFDFELFKEHMSSIKALGGFDKELELSLLKDKVKIAYLPQAQVYDEKVSDKRSFSNQRTRWIAAQIRFGIKSFNQGANRLIKERNVDYFDKVLQFVFLPRLMLLGTLVLLTMIFLFAEQSYFWMVFGCLGLCILSLLIATPARYFKIKTINLIASLPLIFFNMVWAVGGYKRASNNFLHTAHKNEVKS